MKITRWTLFNIHKWTIGSLRVKIKDYTGICIWQADNQRYKIINTQCDLKDN